MDAVEKARNAELVERAKTLMATGNPVDGWMATTLLHRVAELEIVRLDYMYTVAEDTRFQAGGECRPCLYSICDLYRPVI